MEGSFRDNGTYAMSSSLENHQNNAIGLLNTR